MDALSRRLRRWFLWLLTAPPPHKPAYCRQTGGSDERLRTHAACTVASMDDIFYDEQTRTQQLRTRNKRMKRHTPPGHDTLSVSITFAARTWRLRSILRQRWRRFIRGATRSSHHVRHVAALLQRILSVASTAAHAGICLQASATHRRTKPGSLRRLFGAKTEPRLAQGMRSWFSMSVGRPAL